MIVKTAKGYVVYSDDRSRRLGKPHKTMTDAKKQISGAEITKSTKPDGGSYGGNPR